MKPASACWHAWEPGLVGAMLGAAGAEASRPEDLPKGVGLIEGGYQLTEIQATQILEMRLHRLTGLEQDRLTDEYKQLLEVIAGLIHILEDPDRLLQVIRGSWSTSRPSSATNVAPKSATAKKTWTSST